MRSDAFIENVSTNMSIDGAQRIIQQIYIGISVTSSCQTENLNAIIRYHSIYILNSFSLTSYELFDHHLVYPFHRLLSNLHVQIDRNLAKVHNILRLYYIDADRSSHQIRYFGEQMQQKPMDLDLHTRWTRLY